MSTLKSKQLHKARKPPTTGVAKKRTKKPKKSLRVTDRTTGEKLIPKMATSRGRRKPAMLSEHAQQSAFISWCRKASEMQSNEVLREVLYWIHAIPNGFLNTSLKRLKAAQEGMRSGVHDVFVPCPQLGNLLSSVPVIGALARVTGYHGFYIEFKRPGEKMSENQERFAGFLALVKYKTMVAFSWQEAARATVEYLGLAEGTYPHIGESEYEAYKRITRGKGGKG